MHSLLNTAHTISFADLECAQSVCQWKSSRRSPGRSFDGMFAFEYLADCLSNFIWTIRIHSWIVRSGKFWNKFIFEDWFSNGMNIASMNFFVVSSDRGWLECVLLHFNKEKTKVCFALTVNRVVRDADLLFLPHYRIDFHDWRLSMATQSFSRLYADCCFFWNTREHILTFAWPSDCRWFDHTNNPQDRLEQVEYSILRWCRCSCRTNLDSFVRRATAADSILSSSPIIIPSSVNHAKDKSKWKFTCRGTHLACKRRVTKTSWRRSYVYIYS